MADTTRPCPQAWHGGLRAGLLVECRFERGHRGWHRNNDRGISWGGKLTAEEKRIAAALRATPTETVSRG